MCTERRKSLNSRMRPFNYEEVPTQQNILCSSAHKPSLLLCLTLSEYSTLHMVYNWISFINAFITVCITLRINTQQGVLLTLNNTDMHATRSPKKAIAWANSRVQHYTTKNLNTYWSLSKAYVLYTAALP